MVMSVEHGLPVDGEKTEEVVAPAEEQPKEVEGASEDEEGWSIKDVPEQIRADVEKAIKPFHAKYTKTRQEYKKKLKEWEQEKASYVPKTEFEKTVEAFRNALQDDEYRNVLRKNLGIEAPQKTEYPEGWNSPDAVQARNLLLNEFKQAVIKELAPAFQGQQGIQNQVMQLLTRDAQSEIDHTQAAIKKEGLPWNDEILEGCIERVRLSAQKGKTMTLREAYDSYYKPIIKAHQEIEASKAEGKKGFKTFQPTTSGNKQLTGDDKLRAIINNLPIQDETL